MGPAVVSKEKIIANLGTIVGASHVKTSPDDLAVYGNDWTKRYTPAPTCAVFPATTDEVSQILAYCNDHRIAVVPSGGRTGLAGGAVAIQGEVVVSLTRMNKIERLDPIGLTIHAEAGVTTEALQDAARDAGLFFPLDLASKGSAHIGGNVATNAGGLKVIRFGNMRDSVLGMEVVLGDGRVLHLDANLRKDNTGYDLKQLFISSEGTLGIITRVTIKLQARLKDLRIACMAVSAFDKIPEILKSANLGAFRPTAFEFFTNEALRIVLAHNKSLRDPFAAQHPFYVLIEMESSGGAADEVTGLEGLLEKLFEAGLVEDAVISSNSAEFKGIWSLRENITESLAAYGHVRKNDISLPIDRLQSFIAELQTEVKQSAHPHIKLILFGHIGDGNIHINYIAKKAEMEFPKFQADGRAIEERIFSRLRNYRGSISAEHGIGLTKKEDLKFSKDEFEIDLMRQIKKIFDPNGILNPGKIFDL